jgi:hypothetical protein
MTIINMMQDINVTVGKRGETAGMKTPTLYLRDTLIDAMIDMMISARTSATIVATETTVVSEEIVATTGVDLLGSQSCLLLSS